MEILIQKRAGEAEMKLFDLAQLRAAQPELSDDEIANALRKSMPNYRYELGLLELKP